MNLMFLVALILLGSLLISMEVFPNQWGMLNEKPIGYQIIWMIKGLSLSLIVIAFWLRVYQNMYETKDEIINEFEKNLNNTNFLTDLESDPTPWFSHLDDKVFAKVFEVVLNLVVVSILPAVAAWTVYQGYSQLMRPTSEWGTTTTVESLTERSSRDSVDKNLMESLQTNCSITTLKKVLEHDNSLL